MKKKLSYIKLVYRINSNGEYVRYGVGSIHALTTDFPFLRELGMISLEKPIVVVRRVYFHYGLGDGLAWIDKHGNVIVRCMNISQTKIDF